MGEAPFIEIITIPVIVKHFRTGMWQAIRTRLALHDFLKDILERMYLYASNMSFVCKKTLSISCNETAAF